MPEIVGKWGPALPLKIKGKSWPSIEFTKIVKNDFNPELSFAKAVACSRDGTMVVIGTGYLNETIPVGATTPWLFSNIGLVNLTEMWNEVNQIQPASAMDIDAYSVAMSVDGTTLLMGCLDVDNQGSQVPGKVCHFLRVNDAWVEQTEFPDPVTFSLPGVTDKKLNFGTGVALNTTAEHVLITAAGQSSDSVADTAVYYYVRVNGTDWDLKQVFQSEDDTEDGSFGASVAMNGAGTLALFGSKDEVAGSFCVYTRAGDVWSKQQRIVASGSQIGGAFGTAIALSNDGTLALVGAPLETVVKNGVSYGQAGVVYVYKRNELGTWLKMDRLVPEIPTAGMRFGVSIATNEFGNLAYVGSMEMRDNIMERGSLSLLI